MLLLYEHMETCGMTLQMTSDTSLTSSPPSPGNRIGTEREGTFVTCIVCLLHTSEAALFNTDLGATLDNTLCNPTAPDTYARDFTSTNDSIVRAIRPWGVGSSMGRKVDAKRILLQRALERSD